MTAFGKWLLWTAKCRFTTLANSLENHLGCDFADAPPVRAGLSRKTGRTGKLQSYDRMNLTVRAGSHGSCGSEDRENGYVQGRRQVHRTCIGGYQELRIPNYCAKLFKACFSGNRDST